MHSQQTPYDNLTPDCIIGAVESVGYWSDARIFPLNSYENRVYQVGIEDSTPLIAKFYRPHRWSTEQILEEHQFTLALHEVGLSVVPPLVSETGESLHTYEGYPFALFERRGGRAPELDNPDNLFTLGRTLARIHQLGEASPFEHRPALNAQQFGHLSRNYLLENNWLPTEYRADYDYITSQLLEKIEKIFKGVNNLQWLRLHGDCHPGNILWRDDLPHFVDFDDCRIGPAIQDIWMLMSGDHAHQTMQLTELIEGYEEFRPFNYGEFALIEPLRALRIMHYAAWLARRWDDPTFPLHFPWFGSSSYWMEHVMALRELLDAVDRPALRIGAL